MRSILKSKKALPVCAARTTYPLLVKIFDFKSIGIYDCFPEGNKRRLKIEDFKEHLAFKIFDFNKPSKAAVAVCAACIPSAHRKGYHAQEEQKMYIWFYYVKLRKAV